MTVAAPRRAWDVSFRGFCLSLLALVPAYLVLAAILPPFDDELYYWCWSRDLQLSYYDHPPMVAYMIRAATELFGDGIIAIRLPAVLSATVVAGVIGWLSRPRHLLPLVLLSPVLTFAAVMVTPDTPLLMFWALYLAWLVKVHERLEESPPVAPGGLGLSLWLLGGLILGCGVLGKYTTGLAAMAGGVSFLFAGNWRRWAGGYVLHAVVAMLVASPILIHNLRHDFVPIRYQWAHSMSSPHPGFGVFAEFVGVQIVLFGTIPITVFIWSLRHRAELLADPRLRVCLCLFALPFAFFLLKATRGRIEGNWAFPCYLACWPLAAEWYRQVRESAWWRWATRGGFAFPLVTSALFLIHVIEPLPVFPPSQDRSTRQWERMAVARAIAKDVQAAGYDGPVYTPNYQWTAILRWHGIDARQIDDTLRASHFTEHGCPPLDEIHGLVFAEAPEQPSEFHGLGPPQGAVCYPLVVRGVSLESCWVLDYSERGIAAGGQHAVAFTRRLDPAPPNPPR
jgi:4-amino-4-deoxy-L-arabinose transferase-like glycosyltransferase